MKEIEAVPGGLEIQLALSALPAHLREHATVYVLNPGKGFEVARKGTNGFQQRASVARTGDDAFRGSWPLTEYRDDILYPIAFDSGRQGTDAYPSLTPLEMQAKGTPSGGTKDSIFKFFGLAIPPKLVVAASADPTPGYRSAQSFFVRPPGQLPALHCRVFLSLRQLKKHGGVLHNVVAQPTAWERLWSLPSPYPL